ncbi:hypothetical protein PT974_08735 [Cladobotryum mycophilum]|uniref:Uncharacterized protein n=1 Tax=Cladobotryum mycophilum TaxID=491253 RepID=A0ABR0SF44_9HYPO
MKYAFALVALAGSVLATEPTATPDACAAACNSAYYKCSTAPNANHSFCGSEYRGCLGYNPFEGGNTAEPTTCASKTGTATGTTAIETATATGTVTGTVTGTAVATSTSTPDACAAACNSAYYKCSSAPGANHSFCASEYAGCLGYSPFGNGEWVEPTTCATATVAPTATATATAVPNACAAACNEAYYECSTAPNANHSYCGSQYAGCLGYNPFEGDHPRYHRCSPVATGTGVVPVHPTNGTMPAQPTGTVPVNGAGALKPAVALLALGAIALL